MTRRAAALLIPSLLLAGCFGGDGDNADPSDSTRTPVVRGSFTLAFNATACEDAAALVAVSASRLVPHLPPGYEPADASARYGAPADTGYGAVFLRTVSCRHSDLDPEGLLLGSVSILVRPPRVPGDRPPAEADFYEVVSYTDQPYFLELFRVTNWTVERARVNATVSSTETGGANGVGEVEDDTGRVFRLSFLAPVGRAVDRLERTWHETGAGTMYIDAWTGTTRVEGSANYLVRAGSPADQVLGPQPSQSAIAVAYPLFDRPATIVFLAGLHAGVQG